MITVLRVDIFELLTSWYLEELKDLGEIFEANVFHHLQKL